MSRAVLNPICATDVIAALVHGVNAGVHRCGRGVLHGLTTTAYVVEGCVAVVALCGLFFVRRNP
ncbi:hypothetical protein PHYC_00148 [Phycisphaerales bacterium]|nr:hypothetical protein PHYC_00148 [Phycisphaerales bacterium]